MNGLRSFIIRQVKQGLTPEQILQQEIEEGNPVFEQIVHLEQGDKYLYDINVTLFVDYSLAEESMDELTKIKEEIV